MPCRVTLVEQAPFPLEDHLPAGARMERVPWTIGPPHLNPESADLIVIALVADPVAAESGLAWLEGPLRAPTLILLPDRTDETVTRRVLTLADEFLFWPTGVAELRWRLFRLLRDGAEDEAESAERRVFRDMALHQLVGSHPAFVRLLERLPRLAQSQGTLLITGETGTGKELCARAVHHLSARRAFPFVTVDCGAFPDHLLENELFGHVRGAFTDAHRDQKGLAALAEGGTLFLDEVDALSLPAQGKLLRLIQERTYRPLGSDRFVQVDLKVMAASNRSLETCVSDKQFRADLFFRLNVLHLHLMPLRERSSDIPLLARHFLEGLCATTGERKTWTAAALRKLMRHVWPGNVRELSNVTQRAFVSSSGPQIQAGDVALQAEPEGARDHVESYREARVRAVLDFERRYVEEMLRKHHGNITQAARDARKDRRAFGRLVKKHDLCRP